VEPVARAEDPYTFLADTAVSVEAPTIKEKRRYLRRDMKAE
jgi:hypothetical protein